MANITRLDKLIADCTNCTRKDAKTLLASGKVKVNGVATKKADTKVNSADIVEVDGRVLTTNKYVYILLNKPMGYVCATQDREHRTVIELLPQELARKGLFPVGRLDKDTTGMLIITDDGDFAHEVLSPANHLPKTYIAKLDTPITQQMMDGFASGIQLKDEKQCKPAKLIAHDEKTAEVTITEGMYHQIKRMFGCYGAKVLELERVAIGGLYMPSDIELGTARVLTEAEILLCKSV